MIETPPHYYSQPFMANGMPLYGSYLFRDGKNVGWHETCRLRPHGRSTKQISMYRPHNFGVYWGWQQNGLEVWNTRAQAAQEAFKLDLKGIPG